MRLPLADRLILLVAAVALVTGAAVATSEHFQQLARDRRDFAMATTGGVPERAPPLMVEFGCGGCHTIPGVKGARGHVGPSLQDISKRVYIAGVLTNTPENMIRWLLDPPAIDPMTAMPVTGISEAQARDIAAYLLHRS